MADISSGLGRMIEESLNEVYIFHADTLRFIQVNRGARENLGYSSDELKTLTSLDIKPDYTPEAFNALVKPLRDGVEQAVTFQTRHRRKDGSDYDVEASLQLMQDQDPPVFLAIINDITERLKMEVRLTESEVHLANAQRIAHVGSFDTDLRTLDSHWSAETFRIFGYGEERFQPTFDISKSHFHPDDEERALQLFRDSIKAGGPSYSADYRIVQKGGAVRHVHSEGETVFDEDGIAIHMHGTLQDVTSLNQVQMSLRQSEERFRDVADASSDFIWETDAEGRMTYVSEQLEDLTGAKPSSLLGMTPWEVHRANIQSTGAEDIEQAIASQQPFHRLQSSMTYEDGITLYWSISGKPFYTEEGTFAGFRGGVA
jgi:PAS domain S-box-containing protein